MLNHDTSVPASNTAARPQSPLAAALAGMAALAVAIGIGRFAFTPILPMMLQDTGLTIAAGGLLASANYLGYLLGALSAMAIRIRPETAIPAGLLAIVLTTLAMGWPLPFAAWLLLRLLAGVASAWLLISVSAWCLETLAAHSRPFLNSVVFAGVGSGIAAAGLLCIGLIHADLGSAYAWTALGLFSALVTVVVWRRFRPHKAPVAAATPPRSRPRYHWNMTSMRIVACYGIFGFGYIIPATFLPVMAKTALQGASSFAWSWPVFGIAAALSTLMVAPLVKYAGNRRVWVVGQMIMAAGVALPAFWPHLLAILIAALCVGGTFMVVTLVALQEAKRIAGQDATTLIAAMTAAFATGQIVGPLTVSAGLGNGSFSIALIIAAVLLAVSALLLTIRDAQPSPSSH
jgi:predicted MFS family arabinose efflux permease